MPSLKYPVLLDKIVNALFPSQLEKYHPMEQYEEEEIPLVTKEELLEAYVIKWGMQKLRATWN